MILHIRNTATPSVKHPPPSIEDKNSDPLLGLLKSRHAICLKELATQLDMQAEDIHSRLQLMIDAGNVEVIAPVGFSRTDESLDHPTSMRLLYYRMTQPPPQSFSRQKRLASLTHQAEHPRWTSD